MPSNETNACPASEEMPEWVVDLRRIVERDALRVIGGHIEQGNGARLTQHHVEVLNDYADAIDAAEEYIARLTRELSEARARAVQGEQDTERLDWLERQHVEVRTPTRFGSWPAFSAHVSTSDEEGEWFDVPSDLRAKIDAALSTPGDA